ncbi:hypothetical protein AHAS_Ahas18G0203500 [Arachis hypogaea]
MSSSRNKGKRPVTDLQRNQQHRPLRFLKPIIRPPSFKLALPIGQDKLPSGTPYITLVVPDGRCIGHRETLNSRCVSLTSVDAKTHTAPDRQRNLRTKRRPNVPHLSHFTDQRHTLFLSHRHIEVEATYTRFSGKRDGSFGVISGGWAEFARLCKFEPGGVGIFEVMSTKPVTVLQVRRSNDAVSS